jgi:hypothetical protein
MDVGQSRQRFFWILVDFFGKQLRIQRGPGKGTEARPVVAGDFVSAGLEPAAPPIARWNGTVVA